MRVMKYALVVSAFLFIYVASKFPAPGPPPSQQFQLAIAFVGLMNVVAGCVLPQLIVQSTQRRFPNPPPEMQLARWRLKGILSLAFFEACVLFGFVIKFLHGIAWLSALLFAVGIAAELLWNPGKPPGMDGEFPRG